MDKTITLLFPCGFDSSKTVDEDYEPEFTAARSFPEFRAAFYDHDSLTNEPGSKIKLYPGIEPGLCIGRTWMMKPDEYARFYESIANAGGQLINSPEEYNLTHMFPNVYPLIKDHTPQALRYENPEEVNAGEVNRRLRRFIVKDYVKSVKGYDFPVFFNTPISQEELNRQIARFIELRQPLFTGGIVLKEYVDLKKYGAVTNEYRAFYLLGEVLTVTRNSNQPETCPFVPMAQVKNFSGLPSNYYTVDFAELEDGTFTILETGDGQVSGLSPNQYIFKYYDEMRRIAGSRFS